MLRNRQQIGFEKLQCKINSTVYRQLNTKSAYNKPTRRTWHKDMIKAMWIVDELTNTHWMKTPGNPYIDEAKALLKSRKGTPKDLAIQDIVRELYRDNHLLI